MQEGFEFIDHTADYAIRVTGADFRELLFHACTGLIALMADTTGLSASSYRQAHVSGRDREQVLARVLKELLHALEDGHLPIAVEVTAVGPTSAAIRIATTPLDPVVHRVQAAIKAVTYHALRIEDTAEGLCVEVVLDT